MYWYNACVNPDVAHHLGASLGAVISKPPAIGSPAASGDLAILRWNQRTRAPESVVYTWRFLYRNVSSFDVSVAVFLA
jgi:acid phosphatase (class A)